jgi:hypothetical protein
MVSQPLGFAVAPAPDSSLHWAEEIGKLRGEKCMGRSAFRKKQCSAEGCWAVAMSPPGVLQVRKLGPALRYDEIWEISQRLLEEHIDETLSEIVFDFGNVREIEAPWTPVVAQLIAFARRARAFCRVTALRGQPAAIMALLLSNHGTTSGVTFEDGDLDGDGDVDLTDVAALLAVYGASCP